ncbi:MAG: 3-methyl-2-oxobutanoate hydroxymethyltransferase [Candidatus Omnitrophica bacterium]|nr:3-methyl-2-oxobutanoate hydroxymethyltransferase [Candidatus Omnitrophota bacterium]
MGKITIQDILKKKGKSKIAMLTCYDYSFARILDEAGIDVVLVGDSLANVVLGLEETRRVSFGEMLNHTRAVAAGVENSLVVADMPFVSYQLRASRAVIYAKKFIACGAAAVKVEWFSANNNKDCVYVVKKLIAANIPVMGHIGLTPQTAHLLGGYKVQGKDMRAALNLLKQAKILEKLGVFSIVLECVPYQVARLITKQVRIPTIGIGAGKFCDGQVLVLYDMLGLYKKIRPKFVRMYKDLYIQTRSALRHYAVDVRHGKFPARFESFSIKKHELALLKRKIR